LNVKAQDEVNVTACIRRRSVLVGLTGVAVLSAWKGRNVIAPVLDAFAQGSNSVPPVRLETSRVLPTRGYATGVTWSRDSSRLAAISDFGRRVTVWQAGGKILAEFVRPGTYVDNSIAFLNNETVLTAVSDTPQLEKGLAFSLWDVTTGTVAGTIEGPEPGKESPLNLAWRFALSFDGGTVAALNGTSVAFYSTRDWSKVGRLAASAPQAFERASAVAFSPDSGTLAVGLFSGGQVTGKVKLFDLKDPDAEPRIFAVYLSGRAVGVDVVAFNPDGRSLAIGAGLAASAGPGYAPIEVRRLSDGAVIASYLAGDNPPSVRQFSWTPDGRYLAAAMGDNVQISSPNVPARPIATSARYRSVMSVSFSPDGHFLAAATDSAVTVFALLS
jgi:WD40 repeat protein